MSNEGRDPPKRGGGAQRGNRGSGRPVSSGNSDRPRGERDRFGPARSGPRPFSRDSQEKRERPWQGARRDGAERADSERPRRQGERPGESRQFRRRPQDEPEISLAGGRQWGYAPQQRSHQDLRVWQAAMQLAKEIHELTTVFPEEERVGLSNQLRRAAVAVATGVADGSARPSKREFLALLASARGALAELETLLLLSRDLGYVADVSKLMSQTDIIYGMLNALMMEISREPAATPPLPESAEDT